MKPLLKAAALLTFCSLLPACETTRELAPVKPPADRMDCVAVKAGERPPLPPEHVIDWSRVTTVPQARSEHEAFVRTVRTREGVAAGYIVQIEDRLFLCASDDEWMRDFFGRFPEPG